MELRLLRYFSVIAQEGSITAAAERLHITQPTLSRQLKSLEDELGAKLVIRDQRQLTLTPAGRFLQNRADEILQLTHDTVTEFESNQSRLFTGRISIGAVEAMGSDTLARVVEGFFRRHPLVSFNIISGSSDIIIDQLDKGLLDMAILLEPVNIGRYASLPMPEVENWGFQVSDRSPLAEKSALTRADILSSPLLVPGRDGIPEMLAEWAQTPIHGLHIVGSFNLIFNVLPLVRDGMGAALTLEGSTVNRNPSGTRFLALEPAKTTRCLFAWRKERMLSPAAEEFIEYFRSAVSG